MKETILYCVSQLIIAVWTGIIFAELGAADACENKEKRMQAFKMLAALSSGIIAGILL